MSINQQGPLTGEVLGAAGSIPPRRRHPLAVVGLILAILLPPFGFMVSVVAYFMAKADGRTGKGLALGGVVVSILISVAWTGAIIFAINRITTNAKADTGCDTARTALLNNAGKVYDPEHGPDAIRATIAGLDTAAGEASDGAVHDAIRALSDDYNTLLSATQSGASPDASLRSKINVDAFKIATVCSGMS